MSYEDEAQIVVGSHGEYQWVSSTVETLHTFASRCPQVFLGRHLAVVSTDSGDPKWWAEQLEGWECRGGIAYSPRLTTLDGIVYQTNGYDNAGFDEWYVFDGPQALGPFASSPGFVNQYYSVRYPEDSRAAMFWEQLERLRPESYVADGADDVVFISRDPNLFEQVHRRLAEAGDEADH